MGRPTLLQQALKVPINRRRRENSTNGEREVAMAWLDGVVTMKQVTAVLGKTPSGHNNTKALVRVVYALREAYQNGQLHK